MPFKNAIQVLTEGLDLVENLFHLTAFISVPIFNGLTESLVHDSSFCLDGLSSGECFLLLSLALSQERTCLIKNLTQLVLSLLEILASAHAPDKVRSLSVLVAINLHQGLLGHLRSKHLTDRRLATACLTDE